MVLRRAGDTRRHHRQQQRQKSDSALAPSPRHVLKAGSRHALLKVSFLHKIYILKNPLFLCSCTSAHHAASRMFVSMLCRCSSALGGGERPTFPQHLLISLPATDASTVLFWWWQRFYIQPCHHQPMIMLMLALTLGWMVGWLARWHWLAGWRWCTLCYYFMFVWRTLYHQQQQRTIKIEWFIVAWIVTHSQLLWTFFFNRLMSSTNRRCCHRRVSFTEAKDAADEIRKIFYFIHEIEVSSIDCIHLRHQTWLRLPVRSPAFSARHFS